VTEEQLERRKAYFKRYRETHKKEAKAWRQANKPLIKKFNEEWSASHKEHTSVRNHYYWIFNPKSSSHKYYKGMPFFDGWNPKKGGSWVAGADWILKNLGPQPLGATMHVVHHDLGYIPGNLEWASPKKQINQQMYKITAQQRHKIKELESLLFRKGTTSEREIW
jgi:hypothetical protein